MKKIFFVFVFMFGFIAFPKAYSQTISELGYYSNTTNFICAYTQNHLIVSNTGGINIIDVSNNAAPVLSGSMNYPLSFPMAIAVDGNYAYFGGGMVGYFMIADISNINSPLQIGITDDIYGTCYQIAVKGNYAFMSSNMDTLYVIDISNKSNPIVVSRTDMGAFTSGIAIKGNYAYVGTSAGIRIMDISNPLNPTLYTTYGGGVGFSRFIYDTANDRIFCSLSGFGFECISVANPTSPVTLFSGGNGVSSGYIDYKNGYLIQLGGTSVSLYQINTSSSQFLDSYSASFSSQIMDVVMRDSVFYVSELNKVHVMKLGTSITGIPNLHISTASCFPNPTLNELTLIGGDIQLGNHYSIISADGSLKFTGVFDNDKRSLIRVGDLSPGVYFMLWNINEEVHKLRFIKD